MATHNDLLEALTKVNTMIDRSKIKTGTLGKFLESTGNRIYDVAGRNGYIWVTLDTGQVISAINSGIGAMPRLALPVEVIDTPTGPKVWGMDHTKADNNLGPNSPEFGTGPHSHAFGTGLEYVVNALEYEPLLTYYRPQDPALTLYVAPIFYNNLGTDIYYPGGGLDVTAIGVLPTTGNWCWIRTGIDPSTNLPIGVIGPSVVNTLPLTPDQINLIPFPYISSCAFKFRGGQADFSNFEFDFIDVRFWLDSTVNTVPSNLNKTQFTSNNSKTVNNSALELSLIDVVTGSQTLIPGQISSTGRSLKLDAWGYLSDTGTPTIQLKFKLGSTTILDTGAVTLGASFSNKLWHFTGFITVQIAGASGKVVAQGQFTQNGSTTDIVNTSQTSIDLTPSLFADLTTQWGSASYSNTITQTNTLLEIFN